MRIQHNILAMNAYRNYNTNTSALAKNLEKLSSGYKINRAGDDAAGLAISEKMRAQITGLNAAQKNVKDGISLVKTAEGAMQEIQDMLNRMDYLATQSANGTYDDPVDRLNLNKEMEALKTEIDRIAESANFNGIPLLDGSLQDGRSISVNEKDVVKGSDITFTIDATSASCCQEHVAGVDKQKASFEIDLKQVLTGLRASTTINTDASFALKVKVGNATVSLKVQLKNKVATNGVIDLNDVKTVTLASVNGVAVTGGKGTGTIKSTGGANNAAATQSFNIELDSSNKVLKFEQKASAAYKDFNANMKVTITASNGMKIGALNATAVSYNCSTLKPQNGVAQVGKQLAHAHFNLSDITDNLELKDGVVSIGGRSITFDTKSKDVANGVVGVKDLIGTDGKVKASKTAEFGRRLALAAAGDDNRAFTVGLSSDGTKITLEEKYNFHSEDDPDHAEFLNEEEKFQKLVWYGKNTAASTTTSGNQGGLVLQIGDTSDDFNRLTVNVGDMHVKAMKDSASGKTIESIDIKTAENAKDAIGVIKSAINYVSSVRGDLGAVQNRLEHTANNLSVMAENIQDAESTIRDTDIAEEMMSYTKNNILVQSAQAMLAQANAVPQGVLQLLG